MEKISPKILMQIDFSVLEYNNSKNVSPYTPTPKNESETCTNAEATLTR